MFQSNKNIRKHQIPRVYLEGIKGAEATGLAIFYANKGENKDFIRKNVLEDMQNASHTMPDILFTLPLSWSYDLHHHCIKCISEFQTLQNSCFSEKSPPELLNYLKSDSGT